MATPVEHVSDTAFWVAHYRGQEKILFQDPLAKLLAGEKGEAIAKKMSGGRFTSWAVAIRTRIIDDLIAYAVDTLKIDAVVNLGAGLDTRPYRLSLPENFHWIEVDFPHVIQFKKERLQNQTSKFSFEQVAMDLTNRPLRQKFLSDLNSRYKNMLVLTEGVVPYLSVDEVGRLSDDLSSQSHFRYWILDYFSKESLRYLRKRRKDDLRNAPFLFDPGDWFGFFSKHGWKAKDTRYLGVVSRELGIKIPMPLFIKPLLFVFPQKVRARFEKNVAYVLMERF
jgi:methyltransferase (TIGR00027 family)